MTCCRENKLSNFFMHMLCIVFAVCCLVSANTAVYADSVEDLTVEIEVGKSVTLKDADGNGYYDIGSADELYAFAAAVNDGNESINAELTDNITVNSNVVTVDGNGVVSLNPDENVVSGFRTWSGINNYSGNFNGNGYVISGLYCKQDSNSRIGFINGMTGGSLKNLTICYSYFSAKQNIGAFVGSASAVTVENCHSEKNYICGTDYSAGGLFGIVSGDVSYCSNSSTVIVDKNWRVGGIASQSDSGTLTISYCSNSGKVNTKSGKNWAYTAGIIGQINYTDVEIDHCYNTGDTPKGIVGIVFNGCKGLSISDCYNTTSSEILWINQSSITPSIINCYTFGNAIVGNGKVKIENSYYCSDSQTGSSDGSTAKPKTAFESGEITHLLNGNTRAVNAWGQNIDNGKGKDGYPVFSNGNNNVYANVAYANCDMSDVSPIITYSNTQKSPVVPEHEYQYAVDGNVINETCKNCETVSESATVVIEDSTEFTYDGNPHAPTVVINYTDNWHGEELFLAYTGTTYGSDFYASTTAPSEAGEYCAEYSLKDYPAVIVKLNFTIARIPISEVEKPNVVVKNETSAGKNDGTISGVDDSMVWRKEGETEYTPIPDGETEIKNLAPGTYYIKYADSDNSEGSEELEIVIERKDIPKTNDGSLIGLYTALFSVSIVVCIVVFEKCKKRTTMSK